MTMPMLSAQLALVLGVLAAFFVGPVLAIGFLLLRKRRSRAQRRSPIGNDLLRGPGHTVREQLEEAQADLIWDVFPLSVMPILILALYFGQGALGTPAAMAHPAWIYLFAALAFVAYFVRKMVKTGARLDRLRAGYDAELAVGQELDQLMRQGAVVFHDFPAENFNIDHVLVSRHGVFAVETKGYTKPMRIGGPAGAKVVFDGQTLRFPSWTATAPLEQADRQAQWLQKWVSSAVGSAVKVLPVLALPGWFVERTGRGPVWVFSGKELPGLLRSRRTDALSEQDVQRVAHQLEQRCRTVVPTYRRNEDEKRPRLETR